MMTCKTCFITGCTHFDYDTGTINRLL